MGLKEELRALDGDALLTEYNGWSEGTPADQREKTNSRAMTRDYSGLVSFVAKTIEISSIADESPKVTDARKKTADDIIITLIRYAEHEELPSLDHVYQEPRAEE